MLTESHEVLLSVSPAGKESFKQSDELLEVTQLVDGRGWPSHPRPASSKVHELLSQPRCPTGLKAEGMAHTMEHY